MRLLKRILLFVLVSIVSFGALGMPLLAQEKKDGIGISPTKLTVSGDPGETLKGQFTVLNSGDTSIQYKVYVNDLNILNEDYEKTFEPVPGVTSPVSWITVPEGTKTLAPNGKAKLDFSIKIPFNAVPKGYYAVIFAETIEPEIDTAGVGRVKRVGSLVYLTVPGDTQEKGEFLGFKTDSWQKDLPLVSSIRIQNSGNVHFEVKGEMRLKDVFGNVIDKTDVSGTLLPQTIRNFKPELSPDHMVGLYKVEGEVKFLDQSETMSSGWILVASPIWVGLIVIVTIFWIVSIIFWLKKRGKRKRR
jgi:hypothetical protein